MPASPCTLLPPITHHSIITCSALGGGLKNAPQHVSSMQLPPRCRDAVRTIQYEVMYQHERGCNKGTAKGMAGLAPPFAWKMRGVSGRWARTPSMTRCAYGRLNSANCAGDSRPAQESNSCTTCRNTATSSQCRKSGFSKVTNIC